MPASRPAGVAGPRRRQPAPVAPDPIESAQAAGLRYVADTTPGLRRRRVGRSFAYLGLDGQPIRDEQTLARIRSLAIPPAWTDVWICPSPRGHIQATGRDARGRKQYRYHPRWQRTRDETKYGRLLAFGQALPLIRQRVEQDLARPGLPREKVLATVVRLLEATLIRVGNDEYARQNRSFGLTTLENRHVRVEGSSLRFRFRGKSGVTHQVGLRDRRLAGVVKRCQELPGQELLQYVDDEGQPRDIGSADVNEYLRAVAGDEFTAKDFRTWAGTVLAAQALQEAEASDGQAQARQNVVRAIAAVAERLGNTPSVCRKCYVHPAVIESYLEGGTIGAVRAGIGPEPAGSRHNLRPEEAAVIALLRSRLTA
jgi:DNA topoisomerase-1